MTEEEPSKAVTVLRKSFEEGILSDLETRKSVIRAIHFFLEENEDAILNASLKDFTRPKTTVILIDVMLIKREATLMLNYMEQWLNDEAVPRSFITAMDTSYVQRQPLGVVLIIGAWNYALNTLLIPLLGAIAAGNTVLLKPSEHCPNVAQLLATLFPKYVDTRICQVLCGDVDVCSKLLASVRFDHIMYTGGIGGGRAVYAAAAKFLTPVTLELGGKCPTYVDSSADILLAAKRIMMIKTLNCGQTCITPDYVLCHREVLDEFLLKVGETIKKFFGEDVRGNPDFGRVINEEHWKRLTKLLSSSAGEIVYGGETVQEDLYIAPTVVTNVKPDDALMSEEIFGPILPILTVESPEEAINFIKSRDHALAVYVFTNSSTVFSMFKARTTSGALIQNDCAVHGLSSELPFGGIQNSGFGRYHGKYTIETFSNLRSVMLRTKSEFVNDKVIYPPYTEHKLDWLKWTVSSSEKKGCSIL